MNLYNEIDPFAAEWIRNLSAAGHIASGEVDERSVTDLGPDDVRRATQAHFFAGIAGWSYALRLAGWPDDVPVWTGSCPCQPFSTAGKQRGFSDERHLWPEWFRLIRECRPPIIFGEQVARGAGRDWLAAVQADLEAEGYAFGAVDLAAASVGAPHVRQRHFFVACALDQRCEGLDALVLARRQDEDCAQAVGSSATGAGAVDDANKSRLEGRRFGGDGSRERLVGPASLAFWADAERIPCSDDKYRLVEPGTFPLVDGVSSRVERSGRKSKLHAYGNAVVPQVAAAFIRAAMESL